VSRGQNNGLGNPVAQHSRSVDNGTSIPAVIDDDEANERGEGANDPVAEANAGVVEHDPRAKDDNGRLDNVIDERQNVDERNHIVMINCAATTR